MKALYITIFLISLPVVWAQDTQRDCSLECPINFSYASDPKINEENRENCLSRCEQANSVEANMQKQTEKLDQQNEIMEEQLEEQREEQEDVREDLYLRQQELDQQELDQQVPNEDVQY